MSKKQESKKTEWSAIIWILLLMIFASGFGYFAGYNEGSNDAYGHGYWNGNIDAESSHIPTAKEAKFLCKSKGWENGYVSSFSCEGELTCYYTEVVEGNDVMTTGCEPYSPESGE